MMAAEKGLEETRRAILDAALACFEREGFDALGIRTIAAKAEVSPALVIRYFGSKAELFRCVVEAAFEGFDTSVPLTPKIVPALVQYLMGGGQGARASRILVRSAASEDAAHVLRGFVNERFLDPAVATDARGDAPLRFGMLVALLTGFGVVGDVLKLGALNDADPDAARALLEKLILACIIR